MDHQYQFLQYVHCSVDDAPAPDGGYVIAELYISERHIDWGVSSKLSAKLAWVACSSLNNLDRDRWPSISLSAMYSLSSEYWEVGVPQSVVDEWCYL